MYHMFIRRSTPTGLRKQRVGDQRLLTVADEPGHAAKLVRAVAFRQQVRKVPDPGKTNGFSTFSVF